MTADTEDGEVREGFKPEYYAELAGLEAGNFWFSVRNRVITWAIAKYASRTDRILEIGCGTGFVTRAIAEQFPLARITASEYYEDGLVFARERVPSAEFIRLDARSLEYTNAFDVIGAFDVLEHIEEDELVLKQLNRALDTQGVLVLTVPQHQWLWSCVDERACHVRRYRARELHEKLNIAGFRVLRSTSFVTCLLPAMMLSRLFNRDSEPDSDDAAAELRINPLLNKLFELVMNLDLLMIRSGINLPLGGSRLVVATRD